MKTEKYVLRVKIYSSHPSKLVELDGPVILTQYDIHTNSLQDAIAKEKLLLEYFDIRRSTLTSGMDYKYNLFQKINNYVGGYITELVGIFKIVTEEIKV